MNEVIIMSNVDISQPFNPQEEDDETEAEETATSYLPSSSHHAKTKDFAANDEDDDCSVDSQSSQRSRTTKIQLRRSMRSSSRTRQRNSGLSSSLHEPSHLYKKTELSQRGYRNSRIDRHINHVRESSLRGRRSLDLSNHDQPSIEANFLDKEIKVEHAKMPMEDDTTQQPQSTSCLLTNDTTDETEGSQDEDILDDLVEVTEKTNRRPSVPTKGSLDESSRHSTKSKKSSKKTSKKDSSKKSKSDSKHKKSDLGESKHKKRDKKDKKDKDKKKSRRSSTDSAKTETSKNSDKSDNSNQCIYDNVESISCQLVIHKGEGLIAKDRTILGKLKSSDPYIEVWRNLPTTMVSRTATKYHTLAPEYEEKFDFAWSHKDLLRSMNSSHVAKIVLKVWDYDSMSGPDSMGDCIIKIPSPKKKLDISSSKQWFDVVDENSGRKQGRLQVSIRATYEMKN